MFKLRRSTSAVTIGALGVQHVSRRSRPLSCVLVAPALLRSGVPSRSRSASRLFVRQARDAYGTGPRSAYCVFRNPRPAPARRPSSSSRHGRSSGCPATCCWSVLGLDGQAGIGAAAAVLFAVNVTAVLPATPSNLGVFQAACVAILHGITQHEIALIRLAAPTSPRSRIEEIAKRTEGFLYAVTVKGTTGAESEYDGKVWRVIYKNCNHIPPHPYLPALASPLQSK